MAQILDSPPRVERDKKFDSGMETEIIELGRRLSRRGVALRNVKRSASDRAMLYMSRDPSLQAALFRLVDVAPACAGPVELADHLEALLTETRPNSLTRLTSHFASRPGTNRLVGGAGYMAVRSMAHRFIVGEDASAAVPELRRMWRQGVANSIDLLGEATVSHEEGRAYAKRCEETLESLAKQSAAWPQRKLLEEDSVGTIPRVNLSIKVTALTPLVRPEAPERGRLDAMDAVRRLMRKARDLGAHLHVDMESLDSRELILELVLELLSEPEFKSGPSAGIVLQAYLRDSEDVLRRVLNWSRQAEREVPLTIRLVKGAYWDHETIEAAQNGWTPPVYTTKVETDRSFERVTRSLIDAYPLVRPAVASHNLRSIAHAIVCARRAGLNPEDLELQVLRGLGDDLQDSLVRAGLRCRTYCPIGDLVAGMAYLVRRLLENTSNDSFLASRTAGDDIDELLVKP